MSCLPFGVNMKLPFPEAFVPLNFDVVAISLTEIQLVAVEWGFDVVPTLIQESKTRL
jgi:hypothetical protein